MEAKELMCDDLVLVHGNIYKVFGILGEADCVSLFPIHTRNAEGLILGPIDCFAKDVDPIPLTAEILEKNGFEHRYTVLYLWTNPKTRQHIEIQDWQRKEGVNNWAIRVDGKLTIDINYVHELQRALRCCGLWDLANNFVM